MSAVTGRPACARLSGDLLSMLVIPPEIKTLSNEAVVHLQRNPIASRCNDSAKAMQSQCNSAGRLGSDMQVMASWTSGHADTLRRALRMSNQSFAEYLDVAERTVANWRKRPDIIPQPQIQKILDAALERAPDRAKAQFAHLMGEEDSLNKHEQVGIPEKLSATLTVNDDQEEQLERRRLLQSLAALGVGISPLSQALETVRTIFGNAIGYDDRHHLDSWEEGIADYGYSYLTTSPADLIPALAADLVTVRSMIRRIPNSSPEYRGWCRVSGMLSGFMAKTLSNQGQSRDSRQWWDMAQHLGDESGDLNAGLWVRGQRILHGLYENRPFLILSRHVESAIEFGHNYACAGLADVVTAQAQLAVLVGDNRSAEDALHRTESILGQLPSGVTDDASSVMGWGEDKLRYTEAWVYAHIGNEDETDRAAERALQLYPESDTRTPAQIKLVQAFARIRSGDVSEGIRQARAVYEPLASERQTTMLDTLAIRVLNSVPAEARKRSDVDDYRALVRLPPRSRSE
jgi:DNA-binding transcriptional regulator YiaG